MGPDAGRFKAPSADLIEAIGRRVLDELPPLFRDLVKDVPIRVQDFADEDTLREMEIESPFDLLGLYHGIPVGQRDGFHHPPEQVDMIFLYRRALLDYWCENEITLEHLVRHVLIHEIGHHFGLSDDDMERIEEEG
jgi:predicted Zn-dependent protease with MMP-like domain